MQVAKPKIPILAVLAVAGAAALLVSGVTVVAVADPAVSPDETLPRLVLDPDTAKPGVVITVHWFRFCAEPGCSTVRIVFEDEVIVDEIEVAADGTFAAAIDPLAPPGVYEVLALQETGPEGPTARVTGELTLGVGEQKPGGRTPIPR
jgi:hypothetical protein